MILYYTYKQKTKVFAESLGKVLQRQVVELKCDLNNKSTLGFMFHALKLTFTNKAYPVTATFPTLPGEIYVCSPIWGGKVAAPCKYFLENLNFRNTTVHLLLTASVPTQQYKKNAEDYLRRIGCNPGNVYLFATSGKIMPDGEVLVEQLREILEQE